MRSAVAEFGKSLVEFVRVPDASLICRTPGIEGAYDEFLKGAAPATHPTVRASRFRLERQNEPKGRLDDDPRWNSEHQATLHFSARPRDGKRCFSSSGRRRADCISAR